MLDDIESFVSTSILSKSTRRDQYIYTIEYIKRIIVASPKSLSY